MNQKTNDFFASASDSGLLRTAFDLLGAERQTLVLTDDTLRVTAMTEGAQALLGNCVLRSLAELLSEGVVEALRACVAERSDAELGETIDESPYRMHVRSFQAGLILHIEPAYDIYRTALMEFEESSICAALSALLMAEQKLAAVSTREEAEKLCGLIRRHGLSIHRVLLHANALAAPPAALAPDFAEGDLAVLCHEVSKRAAQLCGADVRFETALPQTCPAVFDARQISQAVCNLITNAALAPEVTRVMLRLIKTSEAIMLSVEDDGRGIPGGALLRLYDGWQSLQSAERSLADKAAGISWGLGLPLAHRIASAHDGRLLWRENRPHGCIFTISLPNRKQAPYTLAQPPLRVHDGFNMTDIELSVLP